MERLYMQRVKHISTESKYEYEKSINESIKELEDDDCSILDLKHSASWGSSSLNLYSCLIVYTTPTTTNTEKPVLTTEDGYDVMNREKCFAIDIRKNKLVFEDDPSFDEGEYIVDKQGDDPNPNLLYFYYRHNADAYMEQRW